MKNMKKKTSTVYLYLTRRDKAGVRIITALGGHEQSPVRLKDLNVLQLPAGLHGQIARIIQEDRMMWEPWVESADTYEALKTSLKRRGYSNLPVSSQPELLSGLFSQSPKAAQNNLPKVETMVRRKG